MPFLPSGYEILLLLLLSYFIIPLYVCKEERDRVVLDLEAFAQSNVLQEFCMKHEFALPGSAL